MKETPVDMPEEIGPMYTIKVFKDPRERWFASIACVRTSITAFTCTPTYTTPTEAIMKVIELIEFK